MRPVVPMILACVVLVPAIAAAEDAELTKQRVEELNREGNTLYHDKNYSAALDTYQRAFDLAEHPLLAVAIAKCYERFGHVEEARSWLSRAIELASTDEGNRRRAEERLRKLEGYLAEKKRALDASRSGEFDAALANWRKALEYSEQPEAQMGIVDAFEDGEQLEKARSALEFYLEGFVLTKAQRSNARTRLAAIDRKLSAQKTVEKPAPRSDALAEGPTDTRQTWAWVTGGVAVAGLVGGVVFTIARESAASKIEGAEPGSDVSQVRSEFELARGGQIASFGLGGASAVASGLLFWWTWSDKDEAMAFVAGPDLIGVRCRW